MIRRDVFAVKNGDCFVAMSKDRQVAINYLTMERRFNQRLGLLATVKLVHPADWVVTGFCNLNNGFYPS